MIDDFLQEQPTTIKIIKNALKKEHCSHAYLLETNGYLKKEELSLAISKYLLCPNKYSNHTFCGECTQCKNIDNNSFSELIHIYPDGMWIKKEQLMELQKTLETTSVQSEKRIYIIHNAEKLNTSASNSILKFLEEPENNIIAILLCDNIHQLLDTIVSRCQIISLSRNNKVKQMSYLDKIETFVDTNIDEIDLNEYIEYITKFIIRIENGTSILYSQKEFFNIVKDKENFEVAMNIMIIFYMDMLNFKIKKYIEYLNDHVDIIKQLSMNNSIDSLVNKINILNNAKDNIKYNLNLNLLLDKIIIDMENQKNE